jgi:glycosyltransferase involved in cell wall biosynthesis
MLMARPDLVKHYEEKARDHVRQQYSWDTVAGKTEAVYLSLVAGRR